MILNISNFYVNYYDIRNIFVEYFKFTSTIGPRFRISHRAPNFARPALQVACSDTALL
jgi:hypothetical protein